MLEIYHEKYPVADPNCPVLEGEEKYVIENWIDAIPSHEPVTEDPIFGFRAAGAALLRYCAQIT